MRTRTSEQSEVETRDVRAADYAPSQRRHQRNSVETMAGRIVGGRWWVFWVRSRADIVGVVRVEADSWVVRRTYLFNPGEWSALVAMRLPSVLPSVLPYTRIDGGERHDLVAA